MPFRGIRVAVPYGVSLKKARKIVYSKIKWIKRSLDKMKKARQKHGILPRNSVDLDRDIIQERLITRLNELAEKYGFKYNRVFIKNQKTVWGSCSNKNNINLNMKLIYLPVELMDYVILHELVHTRIKNHSPAFWAELDRLVGDAKEKSALLKEYGLGLL